MFISSKRERVKVKPKCNHFRLLKLPGKKYPVVIDSLKNQQEEIKHIPKQTEDQEKGHLGHDEANFRRTPSPPSKAGQFAPVRSIHPEKAHCTRAHTCMGLRI